MNVLNLTDDQRKANLAKAQETRAIRGQLKKDLKKGIIDAEDVLLDTADIIIGRMKVYDFLKSLPNIGVMKAQAIMNGVQISRGRTLAGLGPRQLNEIQILLAKKKERGLK